MEQVKEAAQPPTGGAGTAENNQTPKTGGEGKGAVGHGRRGGLGLQMASLARVLGSHASSNLVCLLTRASPNSIIASSRSSHLSPYHLPSSHPLEARTAARGPPPTTQMPDEARVSDEGRGMPIRGPAHALGLTQPCHLLVQPVIQSRPTRLPSLLAVHAVFEAEMKVLYIEVFDKCIFFSLSSSSSVGL